MNKIIDELVRLQFEITANEGELYFKAGTKNCVRAQATNAAWLAGKIRDRERLLLDLCFQHHLGGLKVVQ